MKVLLLFGTIFLFLHVVQSYILLTANMDDVQALAQQLATSPVVDQVKRIWRRASLQFQKQLKQNTRRTGDETAGEDNGGNMENNRRTRRIVRDLVALGKESGYIEPIKKILKIF